MAVSGNAAVTGVPVTVLTGFLGAGKTTLLNRLLRLPDLANTAVMVNEFGEVGLDHLLIEQLDRDTVLLNAGCLCCTVRGDMMDALRRLHDRMADGQSVDRVVIETTGLADPTPVLHTLMSQACQPFRLDGVVTLVDAVHGRATLARQPEAVKQAAVADRLLLSKTDLAMPEEVEALWGELRALNPFAPMLAAAEAGADVLLDAGPFSVDAKGADVARWLGEEGRTDDHGHDHGHDRGHHHDRNRHDARIHSFCLTFDRPLHWNGIGMFLEMLVGTRGEDLLRVKGILNLQNCDRPLVVHGVQHVFHTPVQLDAWPAGDDRRSRIVFIVRDITRESVETVLQSFENAALAATAPWGSA